MKRERTKLEWDEQSCSVVDLFIGVDEDGNTTWSFDVTHVYGSGGAYMASGEGYLTEESAKLAAEYWFEIDGCQPLLDRYLGWFDNPHEPTPAKEPGWRYCPFCTETYRLGDKNEPLVTVSLMVPGVFKSYFYRAHKACYDKSAERVAQIESGFISAIEFSTDGGKAASEG